MSDSEDAVIRPLENAGVIGSSGELCTRAWLVVVKLAHNNFTVQKLLNCKVCPILTSIHWSNISLLVVFCIKAFGGEGGGVQAPMYIFQDLFTSLRN